jgi:dipeptidyl aminopeptidase/acylaminoacyl peptidase
MGSSGRLFLVVLALASISLRGQTPQSFTLEQVLSAPFATSLTAAPIGGLFAWVENSEGRHNLFVGGANQPTRQLTHYTEDDAQEIAELAWSPDASAIAYTLGAESGASGKPANPAHLQRPTAVEVVLQPLAPEAPPIRLGEGHTPLFATDGHTVLFVRDGKIWSADFAASTTPVAQQLVFDRGSATSLVLSPDGNLLAYISRRTEDNEPAHSLLALFDLRTRTLSFPAPSTGNDSAPVFSGHGKFLAWLRSPFTQVPEFATNRTSPNSWSVQLLDLAGHETHTLLTPKPNLPGSVLPHLATGEALLFFPSDNAIGFFSEADGWVHLYGVRAPDGQEVEWLTPGHSETEDAVFSRTPPTLIFASNQAGVDPLDQDRRHLWRLDPTKPDALPVELTYGEGVETHPQIAADGTIAALVSDAHTPMHPALIDKDGTITPLHAEAMPAAYPGSVLVTPKQVLFPTTPQQPDTPLNSDVAGATAPLKRARSKKGDSTQEDDALILHGQLFLPATPAQTKRPAIVFVHGGPHRQMLLGYPAMGYYSNAYAMNQYLASRGFIVLSVNYRCGIGYGLEFRQCLHAGPDGAEEYNDVLAAAKYLRSRPDVDPARIGIWGGSYGGYLTAMALARNSNLFAAGVDFHGVHDWNLEDNAGDWRIGDNAQRDAIAAKALASSPLADLSHWTSPVLLIHGDDDPDVAYAQTPTLADALRARNVPVQELVFPDEVHGFLLHKDWLAAYTAAAAFFERTLKP